jgi:hypothetical protein
MDMRKRSRTIGDNVPVDERDIHFQGFAKLLWDELLNANKHGYIDVSDDLMDEEWNDKYQQIIAQRAYDLMEHIMLYAPAAPVPDLTEWPPTE